MATNSKYQPAIAASVAREIASNPHFRMYAEEAMRVPLLSAEEEFELSNRIANGDFEARERLIQSNLLLVIRIAISDFSASGLPPSDMVSEGNLGLIRAAEEFDATRGVKFSTYASFWIKTAIRQAVREGGKIVKTPHNVHSLAHRWRKTAQEFEQEFGREATKEEVGGLMGLNAKKTEWVHAAIKAAKLNRAMTWDEVTGQSEPMDATHLYDDSVARPDEQAAEADELEWMRRKIADLPQQSRDVLLFRFGMHPSKQEAMTLKETGEALGISRETVRRIEREAMEWLRGCAARVTEESS